MQRKNAMSNSKLLEQRKIVLEKLKEESASVQLKEKRIADAERASVIHEIESQFRMLDEEKKSKEVEFQKATYTVQELRKRLEEKDAAYKQEEGKEQERAKATEQLIRLRDHLPAVYGLGNKGSKCTEIEREDWKNGRRIFSSL